MDSLGTTIAADGGLTPEDSDFVAAMGYICRLKVSFGQDRPVEADRALDAFRHTQYAKTNYGRFDEAKALLKMKRYAEAADTYKAFGDYIAEYNIELSMDNLTEYGNKFEANYKADRRDSALGLWPGLEYEGEELVSIKHRPLFIYTDGLNEAENQQQEQFGDDRLLELLRATRFENARQVIETMEAEVEKHRDGAEPNDDLTMMCIKI